MSACPIKRKLQLDFTTSTAGGLQAMHPLKELVIAAYGFLADASEDDLSKIVPLLPDVQRSFPSAISVTSPRLELEPGERDT